MGLFDKIKGWFGVGPPPAEGPPAEPAPARQAPEPAPPVPPKAPAGFVVAPRVLERRREVPAKVGVDRAEKKRARREADAAIEADARALFDRGDAAAGFALLAARAAFFARHEPTSLPCLCRRCLVPERRDAEAMGIAYVRDFVVAQRRVLFFWAPAELARDAAQVRASMRTALRERIRVRAGKLDEPKAGVNPFTKEPIVIPPRTRPRRPNPFAGRRRP